MLVPRSESYCSQRVDSVNPEFVHRKFDFNSHSVNAVKQKFWWFSVIASINHALNYVVTSYATSLLDPKLGGIILGLSWSLNAVSGMTVATAAVRQLRFKYAMIVSLWGYTIQIASLYIAVVVPEIAWPVAVIGSVISGFTSAIWWTAQGVYFERCCTEIARLLSAQGPVGDDKVGHTTLLEGGSVGLIDTVRADLSAHWTVIYQVADIVVFLALSLVPLIGGASISSVILGLVFVGAATALLGFTFDPLGEVVGAASSCAEVMDGLTAVPRQMQRDARVALLAPFVFGFGISTAMFAYFVNSAVVSDSSGLGTLTLGFLEAFSYLVAVLSAFPYAFVSNRLVRGQDYVIQFGSAAFLLSGAVVWGLTTEQLGTWQNILIAKGLYGLGRGVFEGSCRAVYAGMFSGSDLEPAFSAQTLSVGLSGGICFFLFGELTKSSIAGITVVNGVAAVASYAVLMYAVDAKTPLSWGALCGLCVCRGAGGQPAVERSAVGAVSKYGGSSRIQRRSPSAASSRAGLSESLLRNAEMRGSEAVDDDGALPDDAEVSRVGSTPLRLLHSAP